MSTVDIVLIIILAYGAFRGYRKGLLMEIIGLAALILGIIGGFKLLQEGMSFLDQYFSISGQILPYLAFILIFILIVIAVNLIGKWTKKIMDMTLLGSFDNAAGAILGILKWAFGVSALIWITTAFNVGLAESWNENSVIFPVVESFAPMVVTWLENVFPFLEGLYEMVRDFLAGEVQ